MKFQYRYFGHSGAQQTPTSTALQFAPDTLRAPVHFIGEVNRHLPFREGMSALHDVVVGDLRFQPRDKSAYLEWLASQEGELLAQYMARSDELKARMAPLREELDVLRQRKSAMLQPFYKAQKRYFDHLYKVNREAWFVLDPVITVHPDRVFFECFSQDESSYGMFSCGHEVFDRVSDHAFGTTNVDYSESLYDEFQKIRDYKATRLAIDPGGFQVQSGNDPAFHEPKIEVPDSWVRGFLQVSSAMLLPAHRLQLHPMDVHNICLVLRRRKERAGPRSLRFILRPGQPVRILFEPWGHELVCPRSSHDAPTDIDIRVWGRRRLLQLERLVPVAQGFTVHLLGTGMPSFWVARLPDMEFTLGLSGWTANDWSRNGHFELLQPRHDVDQDSLLRVFAALGERWRATTAELAAATGLSPLKVESALGGYVQAGRVVYDIAHGVWRLRELSREPLPMERLRHASPEEAAAAELVQAGRLKDTKVEARADGGLLLSGLCGTKSSRQYQVRLQLDADQRVATGECQCDHFIRLRMTKGPCEHMLALRLATASAALALGTTAGAPTPATDSEERTASIG
ncbi:SWIM zinc finger family protein [Variovorax paradoxus]|uniref:SWIM zinc finger family protein n=1 Tax=Variovorax paradoxus TaxID=34073 RepID=UPI00193184D8|nr:SWIM zinc finger family protein [Variovorax paradoxus]